MLGLWILGLACAAAFVDSIASRLAEADRIARAAGAARRGLRLGHA